MTNDMNEKSKQLKECMNVQNDLLKKIMESDDIVKILQMQCGLIANAQAMNMIVNPIVSLTDD